MAGLNLQPFLDAMAAQTTVDDSIVAFITTLRAQLATAIANSADIPAAQAAVDAALATLQAEHQKLSDVMVTPPTP